MNRKNFPPILLSLFILTISFKNPLDEAILSEQVHKEKLKWFTDARYGMFIHWAHSCIYGGEISWSRAGDPPDSWHSGGKIDPVLYDNSFKIFNPSEYNPDEWVQLAKDAGDGILQLPGINLPLISAKTMSGKVLEFSGQTRNDIKLMIPPELTKSPGQVVELEFNESLEITSHE
jgi:hypothetical protein